METDIEINNAKGPIAKKVLEMFDKNCNKQLEFGQSSENSRKVDIIDWLWEYTGRLLVIAAPYYDGVHFATKPSHFLPIINSLEQLHQKGIVHGDIRAYNMVLKYDVSTTGETVAAGRTSTGNDNLTHVNSCEGWLIDFDFGGKHDVVTYPIGYKHSLPDGERPGMPGNKITILDDWQSLIRLILYMYDMMARQGSKPSIEQRASNEIMREALILYAKKKVDSSDPQLSDFKNPANHLRDYIKFISDIYDVEPNSSFMTDLKHCGLWISRSQLIPSDSIPTVDKGPSGVATGSPQITI